jgi:hypothetical protein
MFGHVPYGFQLFIKFIYIQERFFVSSVRIHFKKSVFVDNNQMSCTISFILLDFCIL